MRLTLFICGLLMILASGCTIISYDRAFPKLTWYWSKEACEQRADFKQEKQWENSQTNQPVKHP
ncbi:MAG: hypothetical protein KGL39_25425 [Patescibacteria group bacterium]|nr:hypothetical protein [Patescibacteria group bacterium]